MTKIVICEFMDETAVEWLKTKTDVLYDPQLVFDEPRFFAEIASVRGLIVRSSAQVDQRLLDAGRKLEVIGRLGVGLEKFDLPACAARGVTVVKADGANAQSVGEYVVAMTAALLRIGGYQATGAVATGAWPREAYIGREMSGKTLGVIGLGQTGRNAASRAKAMGMKVVANDPYIPADDPVWSLADRSDLDTVLAAADVLTLHTPLTEETAHIISNNAIARMKPGAMLINAARGGVADDRAVAEALRSGHLGGAAIDVFAEEPLTEDSGRLYNGLSNVILTPHIAGVTEESNERVSRMTAENVLKALNHK